MSGGLYILGRGPLCVGAHSASKCVARRIACFASGSDGPGGRHVSCETASFAGRVACELGGQCGAHECKVNFRNSGRTARTRTRNWKLHRTANVLMFHVATSMYSRRGKRGQLFAQCAQTHGHGSRQRHRSHARDEACASTARSARAHERSGSPQGARTCVSGRRFGARTAREMCTCRYKPQRNSTMTIRTCACGAGQSHERRGAGTRGGSAMSWAMLYVD